MAVWTAIVSTTRDLYSFFAPTSKAGVVRFGVLLAALIGLGWFALHEPAVQSAATNDAPGVRVAAVNALAGDTSLSLVGTVAAVDQATILAEASGRVTSVRVTLGQEIAAGTIIATLENASQYASLLQAEGAYEAAVASAASSDVGVTEARNSAVSTFKSAYVTVNDVILNTVDDLISDPRAQTPGIRITAFSYTNFLNTERSAFNQLLTQWQQETLAIDTSDDLQGMLRDAKIRTERALAVVEAFLEVLPRQDTSTYTETELSVFQNNFVTAQRSLLSTLTAINAAQDALVRSEVSGSGGIVSAADAQIKQALGTLRAAQAVYNKTILRSPISGSVQSLDVRTGDYLSGFTEVATIANPNALEVTTYLNSSERDRVAIGDTVTIGTDILGTVTAIAPSVSAQTGKIEVKIQSQSESLSNGETVRLSIDSMSETVPAESDVPISIPITALKVETDRTVVFTVTGENTLRAHEVITGPLLGTSVVITEGITRDMEIVLDARGLNEGDEVTVLTN